MAPRTAPAEPTLTRRPRTLTAAAIRSYRATPGSSGNARSSRSEFYYADHGLRHSLVLPLGVAATHRLRRLAKDFEAKAETAFAWPEIAILQLALRRLASSGNHEILFQTGS